MGVVEINPKGKCLNREYSGNEYYSILKDLENISDLWEQVYFLKKIIDWINKGYDKYLGTEFRKLPTALKDNIICWYNNRFTDKTKEFHNRTTGTIMGDDSLMFYFFINFYKRFMSDRIDNPDYRYDMKKYIEDKFKDCYSFDLNIEEQKLLENVIYYSNEIRTEYDKICILERVKIVFMLYKDRNKPYEFEKCLFDTIEETIEFAKLLDSYKVKLIYLKYAYGFLEEDDKESILPEINRIQDVIDLENKNKYDVNQGGEKKQINEGSENEANIFQGGKKPVGKELKKFEFNGTEESILWLIDLLFGAGFLSKNSYKNRYAILRDTFLKIDKYNQPSIFNHKQLGVVYSQRIKSSKIQTGNNDYMKFEKLIELIKKATQS